MGQTISNVEREKFIDRVHVTYQAMGKLKPCVTAKVNEGAGTFHFPKVGAITAEEKTEFAGLEQPGNAGYTDITLTPRKWTAGDYSDIFAANKVNFSDRDTLAKVITKAIGRREDQLILDALAASGTAKSVAKSIGGSNTSLNMDKLRRVVALFGEDEIEEEITFVGHTNSKEGLLGDSEATSADFQTIKALVHGDINTMLGMKFAWIGNRSEGGLDLTSNTRTQFAFARESTVMGTAFEQPVQTDWIPERGAWYVVQRFESNSKVRDALGVVDVLTHEA